MVLLRRGTQGRRDGRSTDSYRLVETSPPCARAPGEEHANLTSYGGTCALAVSALAIAWAPTLRIVLTADILMAIAGAIFAPTVAAITLGITSQQGLSARLGRNAAFDRAGNIFIAVLAGLIGWGFSQRAVFYLVPLFAVLTSLAVLSIFPRL